MTDMPGLSSPVRASNSPALKFAFFLPKWPMRFCSAAVSTGYIWWRRGLFHRRWNGVGHAWNPLVQGLLSPVQLEQDL